MTRLSISDMIRKLRTRLHDSDTQGKIVIAIALLLYVVVNWYVTVPLFVQAYLKAPLAATQPGRWLHVLNGIPLISADALAVVLMLTIMFCMQVVLYTLLLMAIDLVRKIPISVPAVRALVICAFAMMVVGALLLN
jgi:hypothetical protein